MTEIKMLKMWHRKTEAFDKILLKIANTTPYLKEEVGELLPLLRKLKDKISLAYGSRVLASKERSKDE